MMSYISTRGEAREVSFVGALLAGLAADGGLFVPKAWPHLGPGEIAAFAGASYAEVAAHILQGFVGADVPPARLGAICHEAYAAFSHPAVAPLRQIDANLFLLELFHGPTLAFKDIAMQVLARLYDFVLGEEGRRMTVVCATSGDTGGAAVEAFRGRDNLSIIALYPHDKISPVQRRFMTTAAEDNVAAVAIDGDFDDCQAIVKALLADRRFARQTDLTAVNSINIARIAAQTVYYFTAAVSLGAPARACRFAVPTGNFGDAYAAWAAHRMGLAIDQVIVATNANDILARAFQSGRYTRGPAVATQSPAMDIQVASNFERLYFEYAGRDAHATAQAFRAFAEGGIIDAPGIAAVGTNRFFTSASVDEVATGAAIASAFEESGALIDPHTAVALAAARRFGAETPSTPLVVLATAHPAKFPQVVVAATGQAPPPPKAVLELSQRSERIVRLAPDIAAVRAYIAGFVEDRLQ